MTIINVRDLGARGDDQTDNTTAIQQALDRASEQSATVLVPPGRYRSGTLFVRSDTTLELTAGATLVGPTRWEQFIPVVSPNPEAEWERVRRHFLVVQDAERVTIKGRGTIDGQGWHWCDAGATPESWHRGKDPRPDVMVAVIRSRDVVIEGVRLSDPPNWNLDLFCSDRVRVQGVTIASDPRLPNNDGIDISGSSDVIISDCQIHVGDDGIVLNGRSRPVRRVAVSNCVISSECAALKVGWENTRNDITQVAFANCILSGCNRGLACYSGNGAVIEDVVASNLVLDSNAPIMFARPIHLDLRRGNDTGTFGAIRRIQVSNLVARTQGRILLTSEDGGALEDITLRDVSLAYPYLEDAEPIADDNRSSQFSNANRAARRARAAVVAEHVRGLSVDNLRLAWPGAEVPADWQIPAKRENGGTRIFRPDYTQPRPCAFNALWGRDVQGWWRSPAALASASATARFDLDPASRLQVSE